MTNRVTKDELATNLSKSAKKLTEMTAALKEAKAELAELRERAVIAEDAAVATDAAMRKEDALHNAAMDEIRQMLKLILDSVKKPG